ncbi:MAG: radical SAM protein [Oscillospiraceae bacterium]
MHFKEAKGLLSQGNGMNLYRGCTHGCIYCDARSMCYQINHAFEDVEVKSNAPALLEDALRRKRKKCMIATGAMCDPYLHAEEELLLTRRCLELIDRYGFGVNILTKSDRVLRDLALLKRINEKARAVVQMTLTTYDEDLCERIEPAVSTTAQRAEALGAFHRAGIDTFVWFTPVLPFLNDTPENIRGIVGLCAQAGVRGIVWFGAGVTLRQGDREYFYAQLDKHFPGIRRRYEQRYGLDYMLMSPHAAELDALFRAECTRHGILWEQEHVWAELTRFEPHRAEAEQLSFF